MFSSFRLHGPGDDTLVNEQQNHRVMNGCGVEKAPLWVYRAPMKRHFYTDRRATLFFDPLPGVDVHRVPAHQDRHRPCSFGLSESAQPGTQVRTNGQNHA